MNTNIIILTIEWLVMVVVMFLVVWCGASIYAGSWFIFDWNEPFRKEVGSLFLVFAFFLAAGQIIRLMIWLDK